MSALEAMDTLGPLLLQFLEAVTPIVNKLAPALGLAQDHPFLTGLAVLTGGGAAANLLVRALNRVPLGAFFATLETGAALVSKAGNAGALRVLYGPFEEFLVKAILGGAKALATGFTRDNATCPVVPAPEVKP